MNTIQPMTTEKITILIDPNGPNVAHVAYDVPLLHAALMARHPDTVPIRGRMAKCLYEGLAGRHYHQSPSEASRGRAYMARWRLIDDVITNNNSSEAVLIYALLEKCKMFHFDPWLGTTRLDSKGRIVEAGNAD